MLREDQWARLEALLPGKQGDPGRTARDNRRFVEAVLWVMRTGSPWRDLPEELGQWHRTFVRFSRWRQKGVWERVATALMVFQLSALSSVPSPWPSWAQSRDGFDSSCWPYPPVQRILQPNFFQEVGFGTLTCSREPPDSEEHHAVDHRPKPHRDCQSHG